MGLLTPLFLLGALAAGLPVIFHLIRRTTRKPLLFSSLMFLSPSLPRVTRRSRLEHLLLLLLRCLALCLLSVGFARPFLKRPMRDGGATTAKRLAVLVDSSASMRRANLWADARARADAALRQAGPADEVELFTFDRELKPVVSFADWRNASPGDRAPMAAAKLAAVSPSWSGTRLGNALITAAESLSDSADKSFSGQRQIVVLSDLQEGSRLESLQGYEWPKGLEVDVEALRPESAGNASLQWITAEEDMETAAAEAVRVRVDNAPDSKREQFRVGWSPADGRGFAGEPLILYVPAGQSRVATLPLPATTPPGKTQPVATSARSIAERVTLEGDSEDFDNTVFVVPPETQRMSVLYFGSEAREDAKQPLYFLERAFQQTRRLAVEVLPRRPDAPLKADEAQAARLFFIADSLPAESARFLRNQIAGGKTALMLLRTPDAQSTFSTLSGTDGSTLEEARLKNYAMLADIDFRHPLFEPFSDPRFSDFTKIHFWKYRQLEMGTIAAARIVAKFDNGDAALVEIPVGQGRLLVLTSGWQPADSQLALSSKFVPLLYSLLETAGAWSPKPLQYHVGDSVPVAAIMGEAAQGCVVRLPDGAEARMAAGETKFSQTSAPGVYTMVAGGVAKRFAVNLDPLESRTAPLAADELERLGVPTRQHGATLAAREANSKVLLRDLELENRQKLWRDLLAGALVVLLLETWLASRAAKASTPTESPSLLESAAASK
jgi:hypothetical protein